MSYDQKKAKWPSGHIHTPSLWFGSAESRNRFSGRAKRLDHAKMAVISLAQLIQIGAGSVGDGLVLSVFSGARLIQIGAGSVSDGLVPSVAYASGSDSN